MATSQIETVSTGADKAKLAAAVVLAVGAIVAFYLLVAPRRAWCSGSRCWWAWLPPLARFAQFRERPPAVAFGRDSWREVKKVVWPTRKEAIQMTAYVFAFVAIMSDLPLAHRQDARMGVFRPHSGLEKIMTDERRRSHAGR